MMGARRRDSGQKCSLEHLALWLSRQVLQMRGLAMLTPAPAVGAGTKRCAHLVKRNTMPIINLPAEHHAEMTIMPSSAGIWPRC